MRLNLKRLPICAVLLGVIMSSKVLAVGLADVKAKPLEQTVFWGRDWVQMPLDIQAKLQGSDVFRQRYPGEYLLGFWTNRIAKSNLAITDKYNWSSTPVVNLAIMSAEDVKKSDQELYQVLLVHFKAQLPSKHHTKLQLYFAKSIYLKQGNYCYQEYHSSPGKDGRIFHTSEILCKNSAKYLRLKLSQIMRPLSKSQCSDLQSLAKHYLGG
mgnify:CR=1 FL=1